MALTTFVRGRAYDWSHAIGRGAANGTGFNYPQTMSLGNDNDLYVANRGNENNFGMRVNRITVGGPGEEELLSEFCTYGEDDGHSVWPFGVAVAKNGEVYVTDEWKNTVSVFDPDGKFIRKWGTTGSGPGELRGPAGIVCEPNGNVIVVDSGNNRLQVFSADGKLQAQCGHGGSGDGEFNRPWGITLDNDNNIWVADWKNHRVQKWSAGGKYMMSIGQYGEVPRHPKSFAVTYLGPYISPLPEDEYPRAGILNHPTDVAVDPQGDVYIADWGNHRLCIFEGDGTPLTHLVGDAQVMSKWGQQSVDANPDMMKAYRRAPSLEPMWRFCFPTAVEFNPKTNQIIVADSQRNRLQVYKKVRDYMDFQANL
jgi:DNA-binding beta-propeller fold protein YncE